MCVFFSCCFPVLFSCCICVIGQYYCWYFFSCQRKMFGPSCLELCVVASKTNKTWIRIPNNETREGSKCPCYHNIFLQKFAGNICCICSKLSWKGKILTSQQVFKPTYLCRTWQQILCIMLPWPCNSCLKNRFCKDAAYVGSALMTVRNNIARLAYVDHLRLGVFRPLHKQSIWSLVQVFKKQLPHWC